MKKLIAVMFAAGAVSSTAIAVDEYWQGASGDDWSASRWNGSSQFSGGNAIFSSPSSLTVSDNITATKITAEADTTISQSSTAADVWSRSYTRFRFCVDAPRSSSGDWGEMALSEIELIDSAGDQIQIGTEQLEWNTTTHSDWISGEPTHAVDGDKDTNWSDYRASRYYWDTATRNAVWLDFKFPAGKQLSGYRWYTSGRGNDKDPVSWRFLGSMDDGATWVLLDRQTEYSTTTERKVLAYEKAGATLPTAYSYYRFKVTKVRSSGSWYAQVSDFRLYDLNGNRLLQNTDFGEPTYDDSTVTFNWGGYNDAYGVHKKPKYAFDFSEDAPNLGTRWSDYRINPDVVKAAEDQGLGDFSEKVWFQVHMYEPKALSAYAWCSYESANDDPVSWQLLASNDGNDWIVIDDVVDMNVPDLRQQEVYRKSFMPSVSPLVLEAGEVNVADGKSLTIQTGVVVSGLSLDAPTNLLKKTGSGELVLANGIGAGLELQGGSVKVLSNESNPFSTLIDGIKLGGKLDLGGAEQWTFASEDKGRNLISQGAELVNGTLNYKAKYFVPKYGFTIGQNGSVVLPSDSSKSMLAIGLRAEVNPVTVTLDGGTLLAGSSNSDEYSYIGGGEKADGVVELKNGGILQVDGQPLVVGLGYGKSGKIYGTGGKVRLGQQTLYLAGSPVNTATGGASGYVAITNGEFTAGSVIGGGYQFNSGVDSIGDVEFIGGWIDVYNFEARYNTRYQVRLGGGVGVYARTATNDFFGVSASYGGDTLATPPYVLLDGGIRFCEYYHVAELGIKTTLTGVGGITLENCVATTIYVDQAYTGDTVVKSRSMLAFEPGVTLAGKIVLEANTDAEHPENPAGALLPPDLNGRKNVRYVWATSYEGVDTKVVDENYSHFFVDRDGWLCYGRPSGMSVTVR